MTDNMSALQIEQRVNTTAPLGQEVPPITESNLVITAVFVLIAVILFGPVALISALLLVIAYLKLQEKDYEKAKTYNRVARITAIVFLVVGITLIVILVLFMIIFFAVFIPILFTSVAAG